MDVVIYVIVGLIAGVVARFLMPGPDALGLLGTLAIAVLGAVVGGYLWQTVFGDTPGTEWIGAALVALGLVWLYRKLTYGRRTAL